MGTHTVYTVREVYGLVTNQYRETDRVRERNEEMTNDWSGHLPPDAPPLPDTSGPHWCRCTEVEHVRGEGCAVGVAQNDAAGGEEVVIDLISEMSPRAIESVRFPRVGWSPADPDRCEHGRHSIDHCFDCPSLSSTGNLYLIAPSQARHLIRTREGRTEVRIGTMVHGEPIWVTVKDKPREANVEDEDKLPCTNCKHLVRPGHHTEAECLTNQQNDRIENDDVAADEADREEAQTDGN